MADHRQQLYRTDNSENFFHNNGPSTSKVLTVAILLPVGLTLLLLAGLSLIGSLLGLSIAAPVFLFFSPVLVPAALLIAGSIAGFVTSGAFGIIGLSSMSWLVNYIRRTKARGSITMPQQQLDLGPVKWPSTDEAENMDQRVQNKSRGEGRIHEEVGKTPEAGNKSVG